MGTNLPFLLAPAAKDYLWGGSRLNDDFAKGIELSPLAETWECSTHPDGQSRVAATGEKLGDLLAAHPSYLGTHPLTTTGGRAADPDQADRRLPGSVGAGPSRRRLRPRA